MITVAVYNIKGGVGKTATAVNLSYLSAQTGYSTLLCDLDPQGAASYYFRIKAKMKSGKNSILKGGKKIEKNVKATDFEKLDLLPSDFSLRNLDLSLDSSKRPRSRLRSALKSFEHDYDLVFLDCPPNITLVSENIFAAADYILVPVIPTTLSIRSFKKLKDFFNRKKIPVKKLLPFFSMVEKRKTLHREIITEFSDQSVPVLQSMIPYSSLVERMGLYREPVVSYRPGLSASKAYVALWQEVQTLI